MADYDDGCRVKSISTKCPTKKSRTSSSPPISRRENASVSRRHSRRYSKSLAKTCKTGSHRPVAPRSNPGLAKKAKDGNRTRRLVAIAEIYDGGLRSDAPRISGVDLQTIRDWVLRFNGRRPDGLVDGKAS